MKKTLFRYIFTIQLKWMIFTSLSIFFLILLFDFAEISRKFPLSNLNETLFVIKLSFLRTPSTFCEILHYIYFITATFSLWSLCKSNQMTIIKSSGQSPQQILYPFVSCALLMAAIWLLVLHPMGLFCEKLYSAKISSDVAQKHQEVNRDVWIESPRNDEIIFMKSIRENEIEGLHIYVGKNRRIFARHATIDGDFWILKNLTVVDDNKTQNNDTMKMRSRVSPDLVQLLLQAPKKQNIYQLSRIYKIQEKDRIALKLYELELHKLLANCASFILFALIAAIICFPINRYKTKTNVAIKVMAVSILLRFANNILETLGYAGLISMRFACWGVVSVLSCISIAVLIWKEA